MGPKWTVVPTKEGIVDPLRARFLANLKALDPTPSDEKELATLYDQLHELKSFTNAIRELMTADDPPALLAPAYDERGQFIPNYFERRVGRWVAYWHVDHREQICTGVHVRHDLDSEIETLRGVLDAAYTAHSDKDKDDPEKR